MLESETTASPNADYARARFYSAVEIALVVLILILGALRAAGAPPAPPVDAEPRLAKAKLWDVVDALEQVRRGKAVAKPETLDRLFKNDRRPLVRVRALQALVATGSDARPLLLAALKDKDAMVRQAAAQELGNWAHEEAVAKALSAAAQAETSAEARHAAVASAGLSERPEAVEALEWASRQKDPELRAEAAERLRRHRGTRSRAALERLRKDPDASVRRRAAAKEAP